MSEKKQVNLMKAMPKKTKNLSQEKVRPAKQLSVDFRITEASKNSTAMPVDYTFKRYTEIKETGTEFASRNRLGKINLGPHNKFLTQSLWLNHNLIRNIKNIDSMVESVLEYPDRLGFLDLSHNQLKEIDDGVLKFKNLKVLYLHDNKISEMEQIFKLRQLNKLQHLTLFGNPFYDNTRLGNIRTVIKYILPQIKKLDYNRLAGIETELPVSAGVLRFLEEKEGRVPSYIPMKKRDVRTTKVDKGDVRDGMPELEIECVCCPLEK